MTYRPLPRRFHGVPSPFTEPILRTSFASHADLGAVIDEVYQQVQARLSAYPADYEFHYIEVAALLRRVCEGHSATYNRRQRGNLDNSTSGGTN